MVGRGEVDEDLEAETKEECEKYGKVIKCVIFEVSVMLSVSRMPLKAADVINICRWHETCVSGLCFQIAGVSEEEAVRIFLEFERVESAIKGEWFKDKLKECVCRWSLFQVPQILLNKAGKCVKAVP